MGGSASYRYGKKIANAIASGESEERIEELRRQREEAIAREKARRTERLALIEATNRSVVEGDINPVNGRTISSASRLIATDANEFHEKVTIAKQNQVPENAWRVSIHDVEDYINDKDKLFVTDGGSTIAVTPSGDIISVCKNIDDDISGSDLLARAVQMGGVKLDSYDGNHNFYTKNGFEPVSWCAWDENYIDYAKQNGWVEDRDKREAVVFYRYVGHPVTEKLEDFMARVPASEDYDAAYDARDNLL